MKSSEKLEEKLEIICGITIIIAIFAALIGCIVYSYTKEQEEYKYTVVDKKESVGSYYNIITHKQVIDTNYTIILKGEDGTVVTRRVPLAEYYDYKVGRTYIFNYKITTKY